MYGWTENVFPCIFVIYCVISSGIRGIYLGLYKELGIEKFRRNYNELL